MNHPDPKRQVEIGAYMTAHLWVAEYLPKTDMWVMSKEPYPYSQGPFEVMALAKTLEEAFDKSKIQQEGAMPTEIQEQVDELAEQAVDDWQEARHVHEVVIVDDDLDEQEAEY